MSIHLTRLSLSSLFALERTDPCSTSSAMTSVATAIKLLITFPSGLRVRLHVAVPAEAALHGRQLSSSSASPFLQRILDCSWT